jgi:copper chaperone CopZ
MAEYTLLIDGMHCGACVARVGKALQSTPGIVVNEVRVGAARFTSDGDAAPVGQAVVDQAIGAIAKAGYTAHLEQ